MRVVRSACALLLFGLLSISFLLFLTHDSPRLAAQTTSPSSSISSNSGSVSWDFGPVVAGTVTNVGIQDICPPAMFDNPDFTVTLPPPPPHSPQPHPPHQLLTNTLPHPPPP